MISVARKAVTADFGLRARSAANRVRLGLEHQDAGAFAQDEALSIQVERLTTILRHGCQAHEAAVLQLLNDLSCAADDHVGPSGANQVGAESDRVVARSARGRERKHHSLCANGTGYVNGQQRGAVFSEAARVHGLRSAGESSGGRVRR